MLLYPALWDPLIESCPPIPTLYITLSRYTKVPRILLYPTVQRSHVYYCTPLYKGPVYITVPHCTKVPCILLYPTVQGSRVYYCTPLYKGPVYITVPHCTKVPCILLYPTVQRYITVPHCTKVPCILLYPTVQRSHLYYCIGVPYGAWCSLGPWMAECWKEGSNVTRGGRALVWDVQPGPRPPSVHPELRRRQWHVSCPIAPPAPPVVTPLKEGDSGWCGCNCISHCPWMGI
ncbi:hypothetical protein XELAEV_18000827mg [Xenopus laevis]|nr:hypothetical protein XELAEV_18000827mg [Xenopus laevis]